MITDTWRPNFLLPETILTLGKRQYNITPTSTTHISGKGMGGKGMVRKGMSEKGNIIFEISPTSTTHE